MGAHPVRVACRLRILPYALERRRRGARELRIRADASFHRTRRTHVPRAGRRYVRTPVDILACIALAAIVDVIVTRWPFVRCALAVSRDALHQRRGLHPCRSTVP